MFDNALKKRKIITAEILLIQPSLKKYELHDELVEFMNESIIKREDSLFNY